MKVREGTGEAKDTQLSAAAVAVLYVSYGATSLV